MFFSLPVEERYLPMLQVSVIASVFGGVLFPWLAFYPVQFQSFSHHLPPPTESGGKVQKILDDMLIG